MMRLSAWMATVGICVLMWHECAENPAVFCYLIGMRAFPGIRSRALTLARITNAVARNDSTCLNRSGNFSTPSTMLKD
jgi:hypothetical protein